MEGRSPLSTGGTSLSFFFSMVGLGLGLGVSIGFLYKEERNQAGLYRMVA